MESPESGSSSASPRTSGSRLLWEPPPADRLAELLPAYEVLRLIGRGGMGAVYEALQKSLRRKVAIKILPGGGGDDELRFAERFRQEAFAMARLNHPGIVNVFDAGETPDGLLYFVMELVEGRDLAHELETRGHLPEAETLSIVTRVAEALAYAHGNGIVHRDIKPANLLLDARGRVKVADFGLAKLEEAERSWLLTRTGTTMGTPDYIAPELRKAGRVADARADLFSLGVMAYQMLTGELPRGMFKLPSECVPGLDERWDRFVCRALEPKPEDRYQSAAELLQDLGGDAPALEDKAVKRGPGRKVFLAAVAVILPLGIFLGVFSQKPSPPSGQAVAGKSFDLAAFTREMEAADVETQWALLKTKLDDLNGSDVTLLRKEEDKARGRITYLGIRNEGKELSDITPVAAASGVLSLFFHDVWVRDLSCLRGMKIEQLGIFQSHLTDLSVLETLPALWSLNLTNAKGIRDFTPLAKLKLGVLHLNHNPHLTDLSFVRGMPLSQLNVRDTGVTDLSPLAGMGIRELECDAEIPFTADWLRSMPKLEKINGEPVEVWRKKAGLPGETGPTASAAVDLMPLIDVSRDAVAGEWRMEDGRLLVSPSREIPSKGIPRLELPYAPSEEYDFEVEFEVAGDGSGVSQILSAQDRSFSWSAGVKLAAGFKAGFDRIEGQSVMDRQDGSVMRPADFFKAGRRHLLKAEVRGTSLRGFLDGEPLVHWGRSAESFQLLDLSPRLTLRNPGRLGLAADNRAVTFHRIVVREVTATNPSASIDAPSASIVWSDWLTPKLADPNAFVGEDWKREPGGLTTGRVLARTFVVPEPVADLAVRARYELRDSNGIQITLHERGSGGQRELYVAHDNGSSLYLGRMLPSETEIRVEKLGERRLPDGLAREGERVLEFRCEGSLLTATLNDSVTVTATDAAIPEGAVGIVLSRGARLRGVETAHPAAPALSNVEDVTSRLRELARATLGLAADSDSIRSAASGNTPALPLSPDDDGDYAVRVRYRGQLQISLRTGPGGEYLYVLCQPHQTLFNKFRGHGTGGSEKVGATRTHPASFDPDQEHELLVVVTGGRFQAWMDGNWWGEGRDPGLIEGGAQLMFLPGMAVIRAEISVAAKPE